jgi:hypothetical protein
LRFPATLAVLLALGFAPPSAHAEAPARVVLVRPAPSQPWAEEMLTRAAGELRAAGFEPVLADAAPGEDPRAAFRRLDRDAVAVIALASDDAEIWVEDRLTGKISIRAAKLASDPRRPASDVAIEAVELLRASLIELTVRSRAPVTTKAAPPRAAVAFAEAALPARRTQAAEGGRAGLHFAAGPALFAGFDPGSVHFAPMFSAGFVTSIGLGAHLRFVGPGEGPDLDAPGGAVSWSPWVLAAGPTYEAALSKRWFLRGSVDVGLFHLSATGDLAAPAKSRGGTALDAVFLGGGAVGVALTEHVAVTLGVEMLVTAPPPTVEVGGETVATAGRPWLLVPLGLEVTP